MPRITYYSVFGYPVRNTGIERIALCFLIFIAFQLVPLPHFLIRLLSPSSAELYSTAASLAGVEAGFHPLTLDPFLTLSKLLEYVCYFLIYLVIVNASPTKTYQRVILTTFILSAGFQAVYGLVEFLSGHHHIFFYEKVVNRDYATGTFINRNHFAVYLELSIPLLLAVIAGHLGNFWRIKGTVSHRIARSLEGEGGMILFFLALLAAMTLALVFSQSRGGVLFGAVSSMMFFVLYWSMKGRISHTLLKVAVLGVALTVALWYFGGPILGRFAKITREFTADRSRIQLYQDTLSICADFPITGSGAGTFRRVFPMYKNFTTKSYYRYAHNDYAQTLAETGVFGGLILVGLILAGWYRIHRIVSGGFNSTSVLQIGLFCSLLACALHSLTEFGLQIPGVALAFTILAAVFWRTPRGEGRIL